MTKMVNYMLYIFYQQKTKLNQKNLWYRLGYAQVEL